MMPLDLKEMRPYTFEFGWVVGAYQGGPIIMVYLCFSSHLCPPVILLSELVWDSGFR